MADFKKKGLHVSVESCNIFGDVAIGISFPFQCNTCVLAKLKGLSYCENACFPLHTEETALAYSLFLHVEQSLCGDALATFKSKVGSVKCIAHHNMFGMNFNVKGTVSSVRKALNMVFKMLNPSKLYTLYSSCIKQLGKSPKREVFNYVADSMIKAIKSDLHVQIVGKIKIDNETLGEMIKIVESRFNMDDVTDTKTKPSDHTACDHCEFAELKVTGWRSEIVTDYVKSNLKIPVLQTNDGLLVPIPEQSLKTKLSSINSKINTYVERKYPNNVSDLSKSFAYSSLSNASLCAHDANIAIKELTTKNILDTLKKL